ncbi:MAG: VOC family protein [Acuticoccus sp.]
MPHKPDGYNDASPYLIVTDARAVLAFLAATFDAPSLRVIRRADGTIMHAEARVGDTVIMMGEAPGGAPGHIHVYVPDADATITRALLAGASLVQAAAEKGDGDRRGGVTAPDGTTWWIATQRPAA